MYRQKIYRCGKAVYVEKTQTRVYRKGEVREKKRKPTPEEKRKENERQTERRLKMKIAVNFGSDDYWTTLTYKKGERPSVEEAKKQLRKFLNKMRDEYRKLGYELKYVIVTEYENKSIHHHAIINGIPDTPKLIRRHWSHGRPDFKLLDESGEYSELASYIVKETQRSAEMGTCKGKQRYSCSRNLIIPEPEIKNVSAKTFRKEPKPWKGYEILKESLVQGVSSVTGYMYQYYTMIRRDDEGKTHCKVRQKKNGNSDQREPGR